MPAGRCPTPRPLAGERPRPATTRRPTGPTLSLASGRPGGTTADRTGDEGYGGRNHQTFDGRTDASGRHYLQHGLRRSRGAAALQRAGRAPMSWTSTARPGLPAPRLLVHPADSTSACAASAPLWSGASRWRSRPSSPTWTATPCRPAIHRNAGRPPGVEVPQGGEWLEEEVDVRPARSPRRRAGLLHLRDADGRRVPDHGHRRGRPGPRQPEPVHPLGQRRRTPAGPRGRAGAGRR